MTRAVRSAAGTVAEAVASLPRIALGLEQLLPGATTAQELARLRSTLDRLERLGGFLAEELPDVGHQLEAVRKQLGGSSNRIDVRLELTEQQLRDTAVAMRSLAEALAGRSDAESALGLSPDSTNATGGARATAPHEQPEAANPGKEQRSNQQPSTQEPSTQEPGTQEPGTEPTGSGQPGAESAAQRRALRPGEAGRAG